MLEPRDYDELERQAATAQGLDPVVDAMKAAGLPVVVEQTGGFTMVATVYAEDRSYMGVVCEGDDFLVCEFDANGDEVMVGNGHPLESVVRVVKEWATDKAREALAVAMGERL